MKSNLALIGFMGTGKSAIGRGLAQLMQMDFYDTDSEIEKATGLKVGEIFSRYGEIRFRSEEALVLKKIVEKQNCIISTGGGVTLDLDSFALLKANCYLVCLEAAPEIIQARVARKPRPLLRKDRSINRIKELLKERESAYQGADLYLNTSTTSREEIIAQIIQQWKTQQCTVNRG